MEHNIQFVGEHLWIGEWGILSIYLAFVSALFCVLYFSLAVFQKKEKVAIHESLGNVFFITHGLSLFSAFLTLIVIIFSHYFEYKYAWQHSSTALPFKYLLSSIWEGQEGSFLLWGIWHSILGYILLFQKNLLSKYVLLCITICQLMICSMLLGVYVGDIQIGSNPFILMRDFYTEAPIFQQANYLNSLKDGKGLNELLQNYWMVIHPPILFLGYALTIIPAGFTFAAIWSGQKETCLNSARRWALWATGILGLGIIMGGAWAYESLSFGGYWAWDPVENASLVPWLVLVAALHSCIISLKRKKSYRSTYLLFIASFGFVLYSSYLTRSGILGDTSVHAFTDLEMGVHLILFVVVSIFPLLALMASKWKHLKSETPSREDDVLSREFWLSTGVVILFFSSIYIIFSTSLPVINRIFHSQFTIGKDVEFSYNRVLIWVAVFILLLSSITYFLKYKATEVSYLQKKIILPVSIYALASILLSVFVPFDYQQHGQAFNIIIRATFGAGVLALLLQVHYLTFISSRKIGGLMSHIGFALMILGILLSSANKEVLSYNYSGFIQDFGDNSTENPLENITLIQQIPTQMLNYRVCYVGDSTSYKDGRLFFKIDFSDTLTGKSFRLYPSAFINPKGQQGLLSNPDKQHQWSEDIFVYVTSMPDPNKQNKAEEKELLIKDGDTAFLERGYVICTGDLTHIRLQGMSKLLSPFDTIIPRAIVRNPNSAFILLPKLETFLRIREVHTLKNNVSQQFNLQIKEPATMSYVTLKVYRFPFINLLWLGVVILFVGTIWVFFECKKL